MVTRTGKLDVSEADVSPKKMKIHNKPHHLTMAEQDHLQVMRVAVIHCVNFAEAQGGILAGHGVLAALHD